MVIMDLLDRSGQLILKFVDVAHQAFTRYIQKGGIHDTTRPRMFVDTSFQCHKQPMGTELCGYYVCQFMREKLASAKYQDKPYPTSRLGDNQLGKIQSDLFNFILKERVHQKGEFYDTGKH